MKIISMYLPQFHQTVENDVWWGEGFTDWVTAREAKPLFEGHVQPNIPQNKIFYNLLNPEVMRQQAGLAMQYGLYGFAMYHYYFENGRKMLQRPAEILLNHPEIEMRYCFDWANESWTKTWSARVEDANAWVTNDAVIQDPNNSNMLIRQTYGGRNEWEDHFNYLLPFFKDERYIKHDGMPVFIFYKPELIWCIDEMAVYWQELARKNGFKGIYFIGETKRLTGKVPNVCSKRIIRFPDAYLPLLTKKRNSPSVYDYDELSRLVADMLSTELKDRRTIPCYGPGIDTTPRKGRQGVVVKPEETSYFENGLKTLLKLSDRNNTEFLFINAWNEWGEGMYLEPDEIHGYEYLQAISNTLSDSEKGQVNSEAKPVENYYKNLSLRLIRQKDIDITMVTMLDDILSLKNAGVSIGDVLFNQGYRKIAIYGWGRMGQRICDEVDGSKLKVSYIIDREASKAACKFPLYRVEDTLPDVDLLIISPIGMFDELKNNVMNKLSCKMISAENLIREMAEANI